MEITDKYIHLKLKAVEHDCSANESEIGRWESMDYNEGGDEEWGDKKSRMSDKKDKGNKRVRNENDNGTGSKEEQEIPERDHEYGKCGIGIPPKCCSCGGAHNVAYGGCEREKGDQNSKDKSGKKDNLCRCC